MYLTWENYLRTVLIIGINVALLVVCQILSMGSGGRLWYFLMMLSVFTIFIGMCDFGKDIPNDLHMTKRHKYRAMSRGGDYGYARIYVKMPFAWVRTAHTTKNGDLLAFQELKAEYRHSGKGRTYEV